MNNKLSITLAAMAGICFIGGIVILTKQRRGYNMNRLEGVITSLEYLLSNKRKRHITGGILLSASLLFAGLAFTVITLKTDNREDIAENEHYIE